MTQMASTSSFDVRDLEKFLSMTFLNASKTCFFVVFSSMYCHKRNCDADFYLLLNAFVHLSRRISKGKTLLADNIST